jgi:site-specific DNA-methyltransferase (cytosine-N4-specific)
VDHTIKMLASAEAPDIVSWGDRGWVMERRSYEIAIGDEPKPGRRISTPIYETDLGAMYHGDSLKVLKSAPFGETKGKVQMVFTSPPFPLQRQKKYGNLIGEEYIKWFASFAKPLKDLLTPDGSIVVEIGNTWEMGKPVMSTTILKALLRFLERGGLHLCQEFIWYNPARLPGPVEWVNKERIRVKDAFSRIWWMSPVERPKANNRNVLKAYSERMARLVNGGEYNPGARPSEHLIGKTSFNTNNNGAIPPNVIGADDVESLSSLLKAANTVSNSQYQLFCREHQLQPHPARMPPELVDFFLKFLTDEGDLVLDPFGGSNTTGARAEHFNRRWISIDAEWKYASASIGQFDASRVRSRIPSIEIRETDDHAASASSVFTPVLTS